MIHFKKITEDNFDAIINMKRPEGEGFVAPNSISLAQAWLYRKDGDVFPFAICNDDAPVGFMLLEEDTDENELWLWRIMFPPEHTNKGYGTSAIGQIIELARKSGRYRAFCLDCNEKNAIGMHVYQKLGFHPTGNVNYGDLEMRLDF